MCRPTPGMALGGGVMGCGLDKYYALYYHTLKKKLKTLDDPPYLALPNKVYSDLFTFF